jgi:hypothetical protein
VQKASVILLSFGGKPVGGGWVEYSVPLLSLNVTGGVLDGLKITAGAKQSQAFLDYIRVE